MKTELRFKRLKYFKRQFQSILDWLIGCLGSNRTERFLAKRLLNKILDILSTRGKPECIKYTKTLRLEFLKFIMKSDDGGDMRLPKSLRFLKSYNIRNEKNYPFLRLIHSCLTVTRFLRTEPHPSFESIEKAPEFKGSPFCYHKEMCMFLQTLGVNPQHFGRIPRKLVFKEFHMTSKNGPNGHALWASYIDCMVLPAGLVDSLRVVGGDKLADLLLKFRSLIHRIPNFFTSRGGIPATPKVRKLVCIPDKEGKTREVAILDYWSQCALKPLHHYIFRWLSRIPQDCTFDQTKWIGKLVPTPGSSFHSVDLKTATDRFPIEFQELMLSIWFGKEYAKHWKIIMVSLPFDYLGRVIYYLTGNPMGAYTS